MIDIREQFVMLSADDNKAMGKSSQRNRKKKPGQRTKAVEQHATAADQSQVAAAEISQEPEQETSQEVSEDISAPVPSTEILPEPLQEALPSEVSATEITASAPAGSLELVPASVQAIADAYRDYTRKSLEHAWAFAGKLATARSPVEAFELQMEFAKQACETFVAEAQKIADLHEQVARQRVTNFEGFVAKITQTTFELRATRH